jgi:hypothetical protein
MATCDFAVLSHLLLYVGGGIDDGLDASVAKTLCSPGEVAGADAARAGPAAHPTRTASAAAPMARCRRREGLSLYSMV